MIPFIAPISSRRTNRLTCVGDEGRYAFLDWLLGKHAAEQARTLCFQQGVQTRDLLLFHGDRPVLIEANECGLVRAQSALVPENIEVFYPFDQQQAQLTSLLEQVAIFDSFPYREQAVWEIAQRYGEKLPARQITVVLLRGERRFSSTDLQTESQTICQAAAKYSELKFVVEQVEQRAFPRSIFHISFLGCEALAQYSRQMEQEVRSALEGLVDEYDLFLRFDLEDLLDQDFYTACESYEVCKGADSLWQRMVLNAKNLLFPPVDCVPDLTRHPIYGLYEKSVQEICFWDIRADVSALRNQLIRLLDQALAKSGAQVNHVPAPMDFIEFMRVQNKYGLHQKLSSALQFFYQSRCGVVLAERLQQQLAKLRVSELKWNV